MKERMLSTIGVLFILCVVLYFAPPVYRFIHNEQEKQHKPFLIDVVHVNNNVICHRTAKVVGFSYNRKNNNFDIHLSMASEIYVINSPESINQDVRTTIEEVSADFGFTIGDMINIETHECPVNIIYSDRTEVLWSIIDIKIKGVITSSLKQ